MRIDIVPALAGDIEIAHSIHLRAVERPWSFTTFNDCSTSPYLTLVAKRAGKVVGYAILLMIADEATLMDIAVTEAERGNGIGQQLLKAVIERCHKAGMQSLWLEVRVSNTIAQNLYTSAGFATSEIRKGYYQNAQGNEDAIIMHLPLAKSSDSLTGYPG